MPAYGIPMKRITMPRGPWRRTAAVVCGAMLGLFLAELGLRLSILEAEANHNYWGPGAFRQDADLGYRHASNAVATVARRGVFPSYDVYFNKYGYRDHREHAIVPAGVFRIVVAGASYMVGIGVQEYRDLFHVQLEQRLRENGLREKPVVYNISQSGYLLSQTVPLLLSEVDRLEPQLVVLSLPSRVLTTFQDAPEVELVNGYLAPVRRTFRGTVVDELRTRSYLYRRVAFSPLLRSPLSSPRLRSLAGRFGTLLRLPVSADLSTSVVGYDGRVLSLLEQLYRVLNRAGLQTLYVFPNGPSPLQTKLEGKGMQTLALTIDRDGYWQGDAHWNRLGHMRAADQVAFALAGDTGAIERPSELRD